jgi:hypothetical protein
MTKAGATSEHSQGRGMSNFHGQDLELVAGDATAHEIVKEVSGSRLQKERHP